MHMPTAGLLLSTIGFFAFAFSGTAKAEDLPDAVLSEIPVTASVAKWNLLYSWADGSNQTLALFNPNPMSPPQIMAPTWAPTGNSDPAVTGYGMRGAVGFVIPGGTFANIDSNLRVQLKTSYVSAGATQSGDVIAAGSGLQLNAPNNTGCAGAVGCLGDLLPADYHAWQAELKAASDMTFGHIVVSPFMTLFAKNADSQQSALEGIAETSWRDLGGSFGIDSTVDITKHSLLGLRGSVGTAYRSSSFSSTQGGALFLDEQTALTSNASSIPVLANGEASLIWKPQIWQTIKAYAGMQYDSRAPLAPDSLGNFGSGSGAITFEPTRIFYFGGSLKLDLDSNPNRHF